MALPFRKLTPKLPARLPAQFHLLRLETSPLYLRRERDAAETKATAQRSALWYLDAKFEPRWQS